MLTVNPRGHSGDERGDGGLQRSQIACMHDCGRKLAEQAVQARIELEPMPRWLVQAEKSHTLSLDALAETRVALCERHDGMPKLLRRHAIDEIDHAVLEPAHGEAEHDMHNQRRLHDQRCTCWRSSSSRIAGQRVVTKSSAISSPECPATSCRAVITITAESSLRPNMRSSANSALAT